MEREVGGGIGMGNTCKPMAVSFQCMTKFTTNKKKLLKKKRWWGALDNIIKGDESLDLINNALLQSSSAQSRTGKATLFCL